MMNLLGVRNLPSADAGWYYDEFKGWGQLWLGDGCCTGSLGLQPPTAWGMRWVEWG